MKKLEIPKSIKMIISDFDGVMTDNCIYVDEKLNISRKVNFKDMMAVSLLRKAGIDLAFISGEKNPLMDLLTERFQLKGNFQDIRKKIDVIKKIVEDNGLKEDEFLYIGDDINDIECLNYSKTRITVPNSTKPVKEVEGIQITEERGGNGAFREVVDCLLNS